MKIEKLHYSSKRGYSFSLCPPSQVTLSMEEMRLLLLLLKGSLTQVELEQNFTPSELDTIYKYETLVSDKRSELSEHYLTLCSMKKAKREFKEMMELICEYLPNGADDVMKHILKWEFHGC